MRHLRLPSADRSRTEHSVPMVENLTIETIRAGYDRGDFLPTDVVRACIERIARLEPLLNVFIAINDRMLEDAALADAAITAGEHRGPLHGVPIIIKDNMNQIGFRTTAGYAGFAADDRVVDSSGGTFNGIDLMPVRDAHVVARLKAAGAIILGKSNMPDFGLDGLRADSSHNGDTLNPLNAAFAPGASSTGSAAGVSAGFAPASLGTDTAGSILFPASAQSPVGIKPSFGLVPGDGIYPGLSSHHDVAGPIAKTVHDAAAVLEVLAGTRPGYLQALRPGALRGKVLGLFEPGQWAPALHPAIAEHYRRMTEVVKGLGARTVDVVFGDTDWLARWDERTFFTTCNGYWAGVDSFFAGLGGDSPTSRAEFRRRSGFDIGLGTTAPLFSLLASPERNVAADDPRLLAVIAAANELRERYEAILAEKSIDALFVPRSVAPLPNLDGDTLQYLADQVAGTQVNEMGLPVITVPAGHMQDGRPLAIDFIGRARMTEAELLGFAFDFEQATQARIAPSMP